MHPCTERFCKPLNRSIRVDNKIIDLIDAFWECDFKLLFSCQESVQHHWFIEIMMSPEEFIRLC